MTGGPGSNGVPPTSSDEAVDLRDPAVLTWMDEHLPELRRSAYGQRLLYQSLTIAFVLGLAVHVGGYLLRPSPPTEPLSLVADLLYALGYALWTGVVVVVFVQVLPEANGAKSSPRWRPTRQCAKMLEPEETGRRRLTNRRRRVDIPSRRSWAENGQMLAIMGTTT